MIKILLFRKWKKIIKDSGMFDPKYYLFTYPDVRKANIEPIIHYIKQGADEGKNPSEEFDTNFYLEQYKEIRNSTINPLVHYIMHGQAKGLLKNKTELMVKIIEDSGMFNHEYYCLTYPDIKLNYLDSIKHYIQYGADQRRNPSEEFDTNLYLDHYENILSSNSNPLVHYILQGQAKGLLTNKTELMIQIIEDSGMFNHEYYCLTYPDIKLNHLESIKHYIQYGADERRNPSEIFDTNFYLDQYKDIRNENINPLVHYITHGESEGLLKNRTELMIQTIKGSQMFNHEYYCLNYPDIKFNHLDSIKHYIKFGVSEGKNPSEEFDTNFYLDQYKDIRSAKINPLVHYISHGETEGLLKNRTELMIQMIKNSGMFNYEYYRLTYPDIKLNHLDSIKHYIQFGADEGRNPSEKFDTNFYLEQYKDIRDININPLVHYLKHGLKEGRIATINTNLYVNRGNQEYSKTKKNLVFVTHESSASGAPLLGCSIVDELNKNYNIIHIIIKKVQEKLHRFLITNSYLSIDNIDKNPYLYSKTLINRQNILTKIECVICNSAVCLPVLQAAYELKLPTVTLVHEFSDYTRPLGSMRKIIEYSNNIIVPATIIEDSIFKDIIETSSAKRFQKVPNNIHIMPQGKLPYIPDVHGDNLSIIKLKQKLGIDRNNNYKLIVGSGYVQIRKGVDLFVSTAKKIKKIYGGKCKFVWVGDGYDPLNDFSVSIWLQRELQYSGLGKDFIFLEHQKNLDNILNIADLFCLTSRMDPFPNVVIDALKHDLPIACFENATGISEFLLSNKANCIVAEYLNTNELAEGIVNLLSHRTELKGINKNLVKTKLNFKTYVDFLQKVVTQSVTMNKNSIVMTKRLLESGNFDPNYYDNSTKSDFDKCFHYTNNSIKGLHDFSPKPGFSQAKWLIDNRSLNKGELSLVHELIDGSITHESKVLTTITGETINFRYAVHLHLYYVDLADDFVHYFQYLPGEFDLFITTVNQDQSHIRMMFKECGAKNIYVNNVTNIGRDFGAMLFELKEEILSEKYDVIGHFHSKKSFDINDDSGNRWRTFLLDTLIGNKPDSNRILSLFNDTKLGLVFPEDRHLIDMGENEMYIHKICDMLELPFIKETSLFPIGNMFWARINAIKPLFSLDKNIILEEEPIPYDGSYLHALERITPALVSNMNYKNITISNNESNW